MEALNPCRRQKSLHLLELILSVTQAQHDRLCYNRRQSSYSITINLIWGFVVVSAPEIERIPVGKVTPIPKDSAEASQNRACELPAVL